MIKLNLERSPRGDALPLEEDLARLLCLPIGSFDYEIRKKSLDARRGKAKFIYSVDIFANGVNEQALAERCGGCVAVPEQEYSFPKTKKSPQKRPIVAGFGPAGIFAALCLARSGMRPIVLERGKCVEERARDVDIFFGGGDLNENSNIQYGEGGAGAFSDGKLNTLVKDKSFRGLFVLRELVKAGAPKETLYNAKAHIGTDLLRNVVKALREEIISLGGEILFETQLLDIVTENGALSAVVTSSQRIETDSLFLATGQSARNIAEMLYSHGAELEQKPFSVGFRIEHLQSDINESQYGKNADFRYLPPAEYKLFTHCKSGRTVYSFCMCPGGHVVAAASENGRLVTNGMSYHARDGRNANSAILCEILQKDIGDNLFAGYDYREKLERLAFEMGGSDFTAPAMTLCEYFGGEVKKSNISPTYPRGVKYCDISKLFSKEINDSFREALREFGKKIKGFDSDSAIITAIESRTSSPIRIKRFDDRQSNIKGIYPLGEGAGYAGGIISAAIDGVRSAEEYVLNLE